MAKGENFLRTEKQSEVFGIGIADTCALMLALGDPNLRWHGPRFAGVMACTAIIENFEFGE